MSGVREDLQRAWRALFREKGMTAAALLSLALGLGGSTALFSAVYGVLLRPLPYAEADRIVRFWEEHPGGRGLGRAQLLSSFTFHAWGESRTLEGLAGYRTETLRETRGPRDRVMRLRGVAVSPALFSLLRTTPLAGRLLVADDARTGALPVAVVAHRFGEERFGAADLAVGRTLTLDDRSYEIVGVAPPDFYFPDHETLLWTALEVPAVEADSARSPISVFTALGRLRPGVTPAEAAAEGTLAARRYEQPPAAEAIFGKGAPVEVRARPIRDDITAGVRPALLVLAAASVLVLLIACANVAHLLLARGVVRARELALRRALGASRARVARLLLTESLVLALVGGAIGLALAKALLLALPALAPADFPRLVDIRLDPRALGFALAASLGSGLLAGLWPALRSAGRAPLGDLRESQGATTLAGPRSRLGGALLAGEAALAVVMLVSAGLLVRSFVRLLQVDPGYDSAGVVLARVYLPESAQPVERAQALLDAVLPRLRGLPGVEAAGAANMAPLVPLTMVATFDWPEPGPGGERTRARAAVYVVTPGFAEALSLRLREGRRLDERDRGSGTRALLVNEEFARTYVADGKPVVGRRFEGVFGPDVPSEIVGVMGNVLKEGLDARPKTEIYTLPQYGYELSDELSLAVRATGDVTAVTRALPGLVAEQEPAAAVEVATLASRVSASVAAPRFAAATLAAFALLALVLAATGLYGLLSYAVTQRRRELGIRAALGAGPRRIVGLVLREGLAVTAAGLALGLAAAAIATRALKSLLFGVKPLDDVAFAAAPALLLAVALLACLVPARRAAASDPAAALRAD